MNTSSTLSAQLTGITNMLTYTLVMEHNARMHELLNIKEWKDPAWPLPNMERSTEAAYWHDASQSAFKVDAYMGQQQVVDKHGLKRWATIRVYLSDREELYGGGYVVAVYFPDYNPEQDDFIRDVEYFTWRTCVHEYDVVEVGNCLRRHTCKKCKHSFTVDSSD